MASGVTGVPAPLGSTVSIGALLCEDHYSRAHSLVRNSLQLTLGVFSPAIPLTIHPCGYGVVVRELQ